MSTSSFARHDVVLIEYPFTDLSGSKLRPAAVLSVSHPSADLVLTSLTSRTTGLFPGEFVLRDWRDAGLRLPTAAKRGIFTLDESLVHRHLGHLAPGDAHALENAWRTWLGL